MPFKTSGTLTPQYMLSKNKKGKRMSEYNGGRGVFEKDVGENLSDSLLGVLKMTDEARHWEEVDSATRDAEIDQMRPINRDWLFKKLEQPVRVKPSRSRDVKIPAQIEKNIDNYIKTLKR